mmetsp:Transcript_7510/g.23282  ORF Transcript_7510/g.23282 Transcript_7510/m.23282 type:complete len:214 (+) Transcript_7510:1478-2119(+)
MLLASSSGWQCALPAAPSPWLASCDSSSSMRRRSCRTSDVTRASGVCTEGGLDKQQPATPWLWSPPALSAPLIVGGCTSGPTTCVGKPRLVTVATMASTEATASWPAAWRTTWIFASPVPRSTVVETTAGSEASASVTERTQPPQRSPSMRSVMNGADGSTLAAESAVSVATPAASAGVSVADGGCIEADSTAASMLATIRSATANGDSTRSG